MHDWFQRRWGARPPGLNLGAELGFPCVVRRRRGKLILRASPVLAFAASRVSPRSSDYSLVFSYYESYERTVVAATLYFTSYYE